MFKYLKRFWNFISQLGLGSALDISLQEKNKRIFFNRAIFVGLISSLSQVFTIWSFIGIEALYSLLMGAVIIVSLVIHANGHFHIAKRVAFHGVFAVGIFLTTKLGASGYFHLGAISVFSFSLIVFDYRKEILDLSFAFGITLFTMLLGELDFFNLPDFSDHPAIVSTRISGLVVLMILLTIFILFIVRINRQSEIELRNSLEEKEELLNEITLKTIELQTSKNELEEIVNDRTSEILAQKNTLEKQNIEKEILLTEVHHRVKNNLQIIVGLIKLQLSKFNNSEVVNALTDAHGRIESMSLVHKKMYQMTNFKEIGLYDYTEELLENIQHLFKHKTYTTSLNIPAEIRLDVETAIPVGLIINEIITNFFKYAFTDEETDPHFSIICTLENNGCHRITCKDNGPGFPDSLDIEKSNSMGLSLITSLVEQVEGEIKFYNEEGAVYEFTICKKV